MLLLTLLVVICLCCVCVLQLVSLVCNVMVSLAYLAVMTSYYTSIASPSHVCERDDIVLFCVLVENGFIVFRE